MIYDIIGDIHGNADKLIGLLEQLGYSLTENSINGQTYYQPPANHRAMFIGDLIDRGEQEVKTLEIVFAMLDADVADAVMGNHEYNALVYATIDRTANDGSYLRAHTSNTTKQHEAFLAEVAFGSDEHHYWLNRFYELPLWIETEHACFVHACWDTQCINVLKSCGDNYNCLTREGLQATGQKNSDEFHAISQILKGLETKLPNNLYIKDGYGTKRHNIRVKWWLDDLTKRPIHEIAKVPKSDEPQLKTLPTDATATNIDFELTTDKSIFIGHYWMNGTPKPLGQQVVCTDYSAAIDSGYLTCYQFDTDNPLPLSDANFVQFNHLT